MAYTASSVVRDPHTRAVVGGVTVRAYRKDTGAAHGTNATSNSTTGVVSFTDLTDGVEYDAWADLGAGPHVPVVLEGRRSVQLAEMLLQTFASVASNGASSRLGQFLVPHANGIRVKNFFYSPTGANNAAQGTATTSASYRRISLMNGGTSGTSTPRIASINMTASAASLSSGYSAVSVDTTVTAASGAVLYVTQDTFGGTHASDATQIQAGQLAILYEVL